MKLKVGSWYMNRIGGIVQIEESPKDCDYDTYPFKSKGHDISYTSKGKFYESDDSNSDLIKEVYVTIEDVEPVSEFTMMKKSIDALYVSCRIVSDRERDAMIEEIERLQKLFEGDENES